MHTGRLLFIHFYFSIVTPFDVIIASPLSNYHPIAYIVFYICISWIYGQGSYQGVHEVDKSAWRLLPNCHNHLKVTCRLVDMTSDFVRYMLFMTCRGMHVLLSCTKPGSSPGMNCALSLYGDIELLPPWTIQYTWKYELHNGGLGD